MCELLGGNGAPCMHARPCDRFRLIPEEIGVDDLAALELFSSLSFVQAEAPAIAPEFAREALRLARSPGEILWRIEWLARYTNAQRTTKDASDASSPGGNG